MMGVRTSIAVLAAIVLVVACNGSPSKSSCTSSQQCQAGEVCGGEQNGPYHCLASCPDGRICSEGFVCQSVASADCPTCRVETLACVSAK